MAVESVVPPIFNRLAAALSRHPVRLTLVVALSWCLWLGYQGYQLVIDHALPPEKISAHQLRVNTGQLSTLQQKIERYQTPAPPAQIRAGLFGPAPKLSD